MPLDLNAPNTRKRIAALMEFLDSLNEENLISAADTAEFLRSPRALNPGESVEDSIEVVSKTYGDDD